MVERLAKRSRTSALAEHDYSEGSWRADWQAGEQTGKLAGKMVYCSMSAWRYRTMANP